MAQPKDNGATGDDAGGSTANGSGNNGNGVARERRRKRFKIFGALLVVVAIGSFVYWLMTKNHETSDDAFIEADIIQIAPLVGGRVVGLHFTDNQRVTKGQPLLEIDPRDYEAELASARASLGVAIAQRQAAQADLDLTKATTVAAIDEAKNAVDQAKHRVSEVHQQADASEADAIRAAADAKRYDELFQKADVSRQRLDQALAEARSTAARWRAGQMATIAAEAQQSQAQARLQDALAAPQRVAQKEAQLANAAAHVGQAEADVQSAQLNLSYTKLVAPASGRIAKRAVNVGDVVQKNQTLASLVVDPPWVVANFKETQLTRMRPGQPASISVDAFPGHHFKGHVDSIQPGTGARFSLLPPENATGNYVKVVQRVPVKIVFDDLSDEMVHLLAPGMSVVPDVDVSAEPAPKK